jgi:hypothetical protein
VYLPHGGSHAAFGTIGGGGGLSTGRRLAVTQVNQ